MANGDSGGGDYVLHNFNGTWAEVPRKWTPDQIYQYQRQHQNDIDNYGQQHPVGGAAPGPTYSPPPATNKPPPTSTAGGASGPTANPGGSVGDDVADLWNRFKDSEWYRVPYIGGRAMAMGAETMAGVPGEIERAADPYLESFGSRFLGTTPVPPEQEHYFFPSVQQMQSQLQSDIPYMAPRNDLESYVNIGGRNLGGALVAGGAARLAGFFPNTIGLGTLAGGVGGDIAASGAPDQVAAHVAFGGTGGLITGGALSRGPFTSGIGSAGANLAGLYAGHYLGNTLGLPAPLGEAAGTLIGPSVMNLARGMGARAFTPAGAIGLGAGAAGALTARDPDLYPLQPGENALFPSQ
jgi:hypothetical protein